jgi:hypothetical protein
MHENAVRLLSGFLAPALSLPRLGRAGPDLPTGCAERAKRCP